LDTETGVLCWIEFLLLHASFCVAKAKCTVAVVLLAMEELCIASGLDAVLML
jgi:hypothetical protein